jgi:hypothetical protein
MEARRPLVVAVVASALALAVLPDAALAKKKSKTPKPAVGAWTMSGDPDATSASFTVGAGDRSVTNFQIAIDASVAATDCGTGTVTVAGPEPMHIVKGGPGNKSEYIVGKTDTVVPQEAYEGKPISASVSVNGTSFEGQLLIAFRGATATTKDVGVAELIYTNPAYPASYGPCEFNFNIAPG